MTKELQIYLNELAFPRMRPTAECSIKVMLLYDTMKPVYGIDLIFDLWELDNNPYNIGNRWEIDIQKGFDFDYHLLQHKTYKAEELECFGGFYVLNYWDSISIHEMAFGEIRQGSLPFRMSYSLEKDKEQKNQTLLADLHIKPVSIYFTDNVDLRRTVHACREKMKAMIPFNSWYQSEGIVDVEGRSISFQLKS